MKSSFWEEKEDKYQNTLAKTHVKKKKKKQDMGRIFYTNL